MAIPGVMLRIIFTNPDGTANGCTVLYYRSGKSHCRDVGRMVCNG